MNDKTTQRMPAFTKAASYSILFIIACCMTLPFLFMLSTSLKTMAEAMRYPPTWIPEQWEWGNYVHVWSQTALFTWFTNSFLVACLRVLLQLITCSLAAYAFAYLPFKGKSIVFMAVLAVLMVPNQVVMIPQFLLMKELQWLDSYMALIIPHMAGAFSIFLFRQYFLTLPVEMIEAAKMDGCNPIMTLMRIVWPNAKPILTTMVLVTFLSHWNDFMWPLIVTNSKAMMVLPVGMANMVGELSTNWPTMMTVATYAMAPIIVLFLFGQRYFIEGMASSGLK